MTSYYQEDLAFIHDEGYSGFIKNISPDLLKIINSLNFKNGTIVDIGCGSGFWINELLRSGYKAIGVDISPYMIKLAKERSPEALLVTESFLNYKLPACHAVIALNECFNYLTYQEKYTNKLYTFFEHVYESLYPGGLFIFDILGADQDNNQTKQKHMNTSKNL